MKKYQGFTMIELLMVLVILSIITAFAVPSYQEYVRKKDRTVAQQEIQKVAMELERFRGKNFTYKGFPTAPFDIPVNAPERKKTYTITVTDGNGVRLNANNADGFTWRIHAVRKDRSQARNVDLLMTSSGVRCMTQTFGVVSDVTKSNCGNDSGKGTW